MLLDEESVHLVTHGELARLLGVAPPVVFRLERAGLIRRAGFGPDGKPRYHDGGFQRLRLYLDLLEAGATTAEVRKAAQLHDASMPASEASARLVELLGVVLARQQERLERQRALRNDLISAREALLRCKSCHRPVQKLSCRTCASMPVRLPRVVDTFFCPTDKNGRQR